MPMPQPPPNALAPGTPLTVGSHKILISKYISEGGFAHVYSCTIDPPFNGNSTACLKRVVVPNKWQLTLLRQEVDAMKRLRGNAHIVSYIDSHASRLPAASPDARQQYEVLLLMEYCSGKGLIDFMNTRLTNRLTEPEILSITGQVTTAVAMCHHLAPPLIHRDIKIENVLIDSRGTYKLCDFGSAAEFNKSPSSQQELQTLYNDIMQNTTPQYRAPEMIDLSRGFPIDDRSDIWALGIFMYKLCYYTTPFESPTHKTLQDLQNSILKCSSTLRFPNSPRYSSRLQNVIACCLREDPRRRPNALQLLQEISLMQGIKNIPDVVPYSVRLTKATNHVTIENKGASKQPTVPTRNGSSGQKHERAEHKQDAFASINKSRLLKLGRNSEKLARPKSEVFSSASSNSLQELIKMHVNESSPQLSMQRHSEEQDRGTLEFLRSREHEESGSRQHTGNSIRASVKNGLRRISTGNSVSSHKSGARSLSRSSYYQERESSDESIGHAPHDEVKRKSSIQRRVQMLFNNSETKAPKTASGYGKYTDQDDISAINFNNLSAHASTDSLSTEGTYIPDKYEFNAAAHANEKSKSPHDTIKNNITQEEKKLPKVRKTLDKKRISRAVPPPCPPGLSHRDLVTSSEKGTSSSKSTQVTDSKRASQTKKAPPPKPLKPSHLKNVSERRLSTSSEVSMPDLDDLEKQFSRRFPSYV